MLNCPRPAVEKSLISGPLLSLIWIPADQSATVDLMTDIDDLVKNFIFFLKFNPASARSFIYTAPFKRGSRSPRSHSHQSEHVATNVLMDWFCNVVRAFCRTRHHVRPYSSPENGSITANRVQPWKMTTVHNEIICRVSFRIVPKQKCAAWCHLRYTQHLNSSWQWAWHGRGSVASRNTTRMSYCLYGSSLHSTRIKRAPLWSDYRLSPSWWLTKLLLLWSIIRWSQPWWLGVLSLMWSIIKWSPPWWLVALLLSWFINNQINSQSPPWRSIARSRIALL